MTDLDTIRDLINRHDGDDRCGCLRSSLWHTLTHEWTVAEVAFVLAGCLRDHPAGITDRRSGGGVDVSP